jgi:uncharacterized protein YcbX
VSNSIHISALYLYPVKSCAGERVEELPLDALGAVDDRRFMLVDADGRFVTQREHPALAKVTVRRVAGGLVLSAPTCDALRVGTPDASVPSRDARVWSDDVHVRDCGDAAAAWFADFLGVPVRLVHLPVEAGRQVDRRYAPPGARTGLSDGFPLLVATDASLADLARRAGTPLVMERFRPNVVLADSLPWEEDDWLVLRVGGVTLTLVKPCARCSITLVDPETGTPGTEPLRALATFRRGAHLGFAGVSATSTYFAWNALHAGAGPLRVGDPVEVVSRRTDGARSD